MGPKATATVIDLSDGTELTSDEIDERHEELVRIGRKIDALQMRKHVLECELGLERATKFDVDINDVVDVPTDIDQLESRLFLDATVDVFETVAAPNRQGLAVDFEINDSDFDERFAVFASSDDEGDHAARRWLSR